MRAAYWLLIGLLGLGGLPPLAQADEGEALAMPDVRGGFRLGVDGAWGAADLSVGSGSLTRLGGASVLGDYYFSRYSAREGGASGFRTTTGVFLGSRLGVSGGRATGAASGGLSGVERQGFGLLAPPQYADGTGAEASTVPYFGLGYSDNSPKGGWGFSADLGLMALNPGGAARLGRMFGGGQTLDDAVRELRLSPLVQIGASYSF